ncbi:MAG: hypothetical protein GY845_24715 [Planctomycetes bacterium]|nr:hypothetical protein [Planctomycetota bacterium]
MKSIRCTKCHNDNYSYGNYCVFCGAKLVSTQTSYSNPPNNTNRNTWKMRWLRSAARFLSLFPGIMIVLLTWGWMLIGSPGGHGDEQEWSVIAFYLVVICTGIGIALMLVGSIAWRWPAVGGLIFLCIGGMICCGAIPDSDWAPAAGGLVLFTVGLLNLAVWGKETIVSRRWNQ